MSAELNIEALEERVRRQQGPAWGRADVGKDQVLALIARVHAAEKERDTLRPDAEMWRLLQEVRQNSELYERGANLRWMAEESTGGEP